MRWVIWVIGLLYRPLSIFKSYDISPLLLWGGFPLYFSSYMWLNCFISVINSNYFGHCQFFYVRVAQTYLPFESENTYLYSFTIFCTEALTTYYIFSWQKYYGSQQIGLCISSNTQDDPSVRWPWHDVLQKYSCWQSLYLNCDIQLLGKSNLPQQGLYMFVTFISALKHTSSHL